MIHWSRCALIAIGLAACRPPTASLSHAAIDTLPNGAIRVRNDGPTAWADTNGWSLTLERTISPSPGSVGEFNDPRSITVDRHGKIFVFDSRPAAVIAFGPDADQAQVYARQGAGPGEVSDRGILMVIGDTLVFQDIHQTRALVWDASGALISTWPSRCCVGLDSRADALGRIPIPGMLFRPDPALGPLSGIGYARFTHDGTIVDSIRLPRRSGTGATWDLAGKAIPVPLGATVQNVLTPDGRIVGGDQSTYQLIVSRTGDDTVQVIERSPSRVAIPDVDRRDALAMMLQRVPALQPIARIEDIPTSYPPWNVLQVDGTGHLWVQVPGPRGEHDHWDVFTSDGILLGAVPTVFDPTARSFWGEDQVIVVEQDDATGLPQIRVYRIERRR